MKKLFLSAVILALTITTAYSGISFTNRLIPTTSAASVTAADQLALLPESDIVVLFDFNKFLNTKLFSYILTDSKSKDEFQKFEQEALTYGLNIRQIQQVAVAIDSNQKGGKEPNFCAVVTGGFDREKLLSSMATHLDKFSVDAEEYQGKTIYLVTDKQKKGKELANVSGVGSVKLDDKVAAVFLNSQSIAIGTLEKVKDSIDVQNGKKTSVAANQQLSNYLNITNASALVRFAFVVPDKATSSANTPSKKSKSLSNDDLNGSSASSKPSNSSSSNGSQDENAGPFGNMDKLLQAVRGAYGSLDLASGVQLDTTMLIRSEGEAKQMTDALNGLLFLGRSALQGDPKNATFAKMLDGISVAGGAKDVKLNINVPENLINELIKESGKDKANKAK